MNKKEFFKPGMVIQFIDKTPWYYIREIFYKKHTHVKEIIDNNLSYYIGHTGDMPLFDNFLLILESEEYPEVLKYNSKILLLKVLIGERIEVIRNDKKCSLDETINSIRIL